MVRIARLSVSHQRQETFLDALVGLKRPSKPLVASQHRQQVVGVYPSPASYNSAITCKSILRLKATMNPSRLVRTTVTGLIVCQLLLGISTAGPVPEFGSSLRTVGDFRPDARICRRHAFEYLVIPRTTEFVGTALKDQAGLRWTTKYATVGTNAFGMQVVIDALNEKGLAVGLFYFPDYAQYQERRPRRTGQDIGSLGAGHVPARHLCQRAGSGRSCASKFAWRRGCRRTWASCRRATTSSTMRWAVRRPGVRRREAPRPRQPAWA